MSRGPKQNFLTVLSDSPSSGRLPIVDQEAPPPERRDAAENRLRILAAVKKLLQQRPMAEICMDEVAREAGVGKGTLYRRFEDRSALCRALLHQEATLLQNFVLGGMGLGLGAPWLTRLDHLLRALFDFAHQHAPLLSEAQKFERGPGRYDHPAHRWQRDSIVAYLERAIVAGELEPLDPAVTADFLLAALDPDLLLWHAQQGRGREALADAYQNLWRRLVKRSR